MKNRENPKYTVRQISEMYQVSRQAVYNWIKAGLETETVNIIGRKPFQVIDLDDLKEFKNIE